MLSPKIIHSPEKTILGFCEEMSFENFQVAKLWQMFMQKSHLIENSTNSDLISLTVYPDSHDFQHFIPSQKFTKWAACEISENSEIEDNFQQMIIPAGMYAVFHYKGLNTNPEIFRKIFAEWLPNSDYELDNRPHFEVLGSKYKNNDAESEEDIYIPIKPKS